MKNDNEYGYDDATAGIFRGAMRNTASGATIRGIFMGCAITIVMFLIYALIEMAFAGYTQTVGYLLSFIAAGVIGGLLQQLWFNWHVNTKMSYPARIAGFGLTYFVVLLACAWAGGWIPAEAPMVAWGSFVAIYLVVLVAVTIVISYIFHRTGKNYTQQLEEYRKHQKRS